MPQKRKTLWDSLKLLSSQLLSSTGSGQRKSVYHKSHLYFQNVVELQRDIKTWQKTNLFVFFYFFWQKTNCELLFKEKSVCMCVCAHTCMCVVYKCVHVYTHTEVTGQHQAYSSVTHHVILGTGPSQNLQFIVLGRRPGQQAPRICLTVTSAAPFSSRQVAPAWLFWGP